MPEGSNWVSVGLSPSVTRKMAPSSEAAMSDSKTGSGPARAIGKDVRNRPRASKRWIRAFSTSRTSRPPCGPTAKLGGPSASSSSRDGFPCSPNCPGPVPGEPRTSTISWAADAGEASFPGRSTAGRSGAAATVGSTPPVMAADAASGMHSAGRSSAQTSTMPRSESLPATTTTSSTRWSGTRLGPRMTSE